VRATAVHHGGIRTELSRHMTPEALQQLRWAATIARTVTSPRSRTTPNVPRGARAYALDPEHAKALWAKSEAMIGERF
jgi:hypothetical protein